MTTENGAISLSSTNDDRVNLFFKTVRFAKKEKYYLFSEYNDETDTDTEIVSNEVVFDLIDKCWKSYPLDTMKILYNWRDCRGGKGDRNGFFQSIAYIYSKNPEWVLQNLAVLPEYGRFLDLIELYHMIDDEILEKKILNIFVQQIDEDIQNLEKGLPISLAAKWIPRENGKWDKMKDKKKRFYLSFCREYKNIKKVITNDLKYIRKDILGPLKNHLKLVETLIVEKRYNEINYETVTSVAMKNYRKLFVKYDYDRFFEYLRKVEKGEKKINSSQVYPHDIVNSYKSTYSYDIVLEEQWKSIKKKVDDSKIFENSICVVDVSGSMTGIPIDVAISLGLLSLNDTNNNSVITFHSEPNFVRVEGNDLLSQIKTVSAMSWGMNTNIERVFDLIYGMCIGGKIIEKLFIFSDMQFDIATGKNIYKTQHENLKERFENIGLKLPKIIYWNLRSDTSDFPVSCNENGVVLLSGYSPSLLNNLLNGDDINPLNVVLSIINNERYNLIVAPQ